MQTRTGLGVDTLYTITRRKKDCAPPPTTSTTSHRNVDRMADDRLLDELAISKKRISSTWSTSTTADRGICTDLRRRVSLRLRSVVPKGCCGRHPVPLHATADGYVWLWALVVGIV